MKEIKLKADTPFHNSVDVAVLDFPKGVEDGTERQRCKITVEFAQADVEDLQSRGLDLEGAMRPVISADEANELIDIMPEVHTEIYKSSSIQQLSKHYQSVLDSHKCVELIKLTKSIHKKKVDAQKQNRHLGQIDKKFMKRAEDLLFGELAAALHIPREDVTTYISSRIDEDLYDEAE